MPKKLYKILAINPGSRYIGVALFHGYALRDWRVKNIRASCQNQRLIKTKEFITSLIDRYKPDALAIKALHPSRTSQNLSRLARQIQLLARSKRLKIRRYSIRDLKKFLSATERINKARLAEILADKYPGLLHELRKEQNSRNPYHIRMFEAVALGAVCSQQLNKN